jgi:hypothetical protein
MKRCAAKKKSFLRDDGGSAIIVVLVTMTFVIVLASILLYMSLVNIQMKKLDKEGKANFYSAESVMNEIRAVVQSKASDAIKKAYTSVLVSYNSPKPEGQAQFFADRFKEEFYKVEIGETPLFDQSGATYNATLLFGFLSKQPGVFTSGDQYVKLENGDTTIYISGSRTVQDESDDILLKGVLVRYTSKGYETTISSDIRVNMPPLPDMPTGMKQAAAPDFAIIARGALVQNTGTVTLTGNAGAGAVMLLGNGNTFNVKNADSFVIGNKTGSITVDGVAGSLKAGTIRLNGGALTADISSKLWASDIILDTGAEINLAGDAFVANDLNLLGNGTKAVLGSIADDLPTGRYFGYGNTLAGTGTAPDPSSTADPSSTSSAILINGRDSELDMSGLKTLMLAGHSYVNYATGTYGGFVMTGESISVKYDQLAYLVPEVCLKSAPGVQNLSNPYQYTTEEEVAALSGAIDFGKVFLNGKKLSDYGISSAADIQFIRKAVGTVKLVYICLRFSTPEQANAYFRDYYNANKPTLQKYLVLYAKGILLGGSATKNLAGEAFTYDGTALGDIIDSQGSVSSTSVGELADSYANLCATLSTAADPGVASPYDYYVDTQQLEALDTTRLYASDGVEKAVVADGDYTIGTNNTPDTVHIVIASRNVTVDRDFTGMIIAGGNVRLNRSVTADRALTVDALGALVNGSAYYFLNPQHIAPLNTGGASGGSEGWDLNTLVTYQNWAKNEA